VPSGQAFSQGDILSTKGQHFSPWIWESLAGDFTCATAVIPHTLSCGDKAKINFTFFATSDKGQESTPSGIPGT